MNAWKAVFTGEESCLWRGKDGEVLKELGGKEALSRRRGGMQRGGEGGCVAAKKTHSQEE